MEGRRRTFCTIFPNYRDYHFFKDPGQIPYRFSKLGYDTSIVCYSDSEDFPETQKHIRLNTIADRYISRKFNIGILWYLVVNARKIDILNIFHFSWNSLLFAFIYKTLNNRGFAYLKLDHCAFADESEYKLYPHRNNPLDFSGAKRKGKVKYYIAIHCLARKVDLWSAEDEDTCGLLEDRYDFFKGRLITVYNGHTADLTGEELNVSTLKKSDIIMTAGRLGIHQKATEILLEAFIRVASSSRYDLHLAGTIDPSFDEYINTFFQNNPSLRDRIVFHGSLGRLELFQLYSQSRIFCLPSRYETLANVFPEAMYFRNVIVTTENVSLMPVIRKTGAGLIVKRDDSEALAEALLWLINNPALIDQMSALSHEISSDLLNWDSIVTSLNGRIEEMQTGRRK